jgi:2'-5' RNA ligase
MTDVTTLTMGVAIAVPEPHGSLLREMRSEFGDPLANSVPSHVTLLPPLDVPDNQLDDVCARLDKAAGSVPAFGMHLCGTGTFRPVSPVVFVAVRSGIDETEKLAVRLREAIDAPQPEFPFHPHVTVAQHLDDDALDHAGSALEGFECEFEVSEFALYLHGGDGWAPQHRFALALRF